MDALARLDVWMLMVRLKLETILTGCILTQKAETVDSLFNPLVTNGFTQPYNLDESIFIFRDIRSNFSFLFHFLMNFL